MIGVSIDADSTIQAIEAGSEQVDCVEIDAAGVFARRSPYLAWLAARHRLIVRARWLSIGSPGPLQQDRLQSLADVASASNPLFVVHPLGFSETDDVQLGTTIPLSPSESSAALVAEQLADVTRQVRTPALVEPVTAALRVPGRIRETEFLNHVCSHSAARLLIDVATLLAASRNFGFDPGVWFRELDPDVIAAVRITGCSGEGGRWRVDPEAPIDPDAWDLLRAVKDRARPDVLLLGPHEDVSRVEGLREGLRRVNEIDAGRREAVRSTTHVQTCSPAAESRDAHRTLDADPPPSSGPVEISRDSSLFVLDDAGVFFSAARQELSLFNTAATFVWCLIEGRQDIAAITTAYAQAFGVSSENADRHVSEILQKWFALGHISQPKLASPPEVPLTTAIAQLLTNARLRRRFRHARHEVAEALCVQRTEVERFVALDPDEVDAQAEEVLQSRVAWRSVRASGSLPASAETRDAVAVYPSAGQLAVRRYDLLGTTFQISADSDMLDRIHDVLAHLESERLQPDVVVQIGRLPSGVWRVTAHDVAPEYCRHADEILPAVLRMLRETSANRSGSAIRLHAAAISIDDRCLLMPAAAGSGKTTLTAAMLRSGAQYLSDEVAVLSGGALVVRPAPLPLTIKEGSVELLDLHFPELRELTSHVREDHQRVRYLRPPAAAVSDRDRARPVAWIVFPRIDANAQTALRPLARPLAFRKLLAESIVDFDRLDRHTVEALVRGMRTVECFELQVSSLDSAVALLRSLADRR